MASQITGLHQKSRSVYFNVFLIYDNMSCSVIETCLKAYSGAAADQSLYQHWRAYIRNNVTEPTLKTELLCMQSGRTDRFSITTPARKEYLIYWLSSWEDQILKEQQVRDNVLVE